MTAQAKTFAGSLVAALNELEGVTKDKVNPHFKSKYADLSSVLDTVRPVFARHGMAVTQETTPSEDGVIVETVVLHTSGDERRFGKLYVPANKRDAQGAGSALTYARRYSLMTAFGVPAEDDDGNAAVSSQRVANDRPTTGEAPPNKRVRYEGTYTCPTQLMTAAREFVRTLESMGDLGELIGFLETKDAKDFIAQIQRDMPAWWSTGEGLPTEFIPLEIRVANKRRELEEIEGLRVRTVLDAG